VPSFLFLEATLLERNNTIDFSRSSKIMPVFSSPFAERMMEAPGDLRSNTASSSHVAKAALGVVRDRDRHAHEQYRERAD